MLRNGLGVLASTVLFACSGSPSPGGAQAQPEDSETPVPDVATIQDVNSACSSDKDCVDSVCDPLSQQCVGCLFDADCLDGACQDRACVPVTPCESHSECGAGVCDTAAGYCVDCLSDEHCSGDAECGAGTCHAYEVCDSSKDCTGQICDKVAGRCVNCLSGADCGEGRTCEDRSCVTVIPCQSDKDCTASGLVCDKAAERCVQCAGHADCPAAYHCAGATCQLDSCVPGQAYCEADEVLVCGGAGEGYALQATCSVAESCVGSAGVAECVPHVCAPSSAWCAQNVASTCAADGLSVAAAEDCGATGRVCVDAECVDLACVPSSITCTGDASGFTTCSDDGLEATVIECGHGTACQDGSAGPACLPWLCPPGEPGCADNAPATCNPYGTGWETPQSDCGAQFCLDGECVDQLCAPGEALCWKGDAAVCNDDGSGASITTPCADDSFCALSGGAPSCEPDACEQGTVWCAGEVVTTCAPDGSGVLHEVPCPVGTTCVMGACPKVICTPGATECVGDGSFRFCNPTGTAWSDPNPCAPGVTCEDGSCGNPCSHACVGRECGSNGCGGLCGACPSGQVCTDAGVCLSTCTPECDATTCGSDGCGGTCGECQQGFCIEGTCQEQCVPDCTGLQCGPDGCGGTCGECSGGADCTVAGLCGPCLGCTGAPGCTDLDFSDLNLGYWTTEGAPLVIPFLGEEEAPTGGMLRVPTWGDEFGASSTARLQTCLPPGDYVMAIDWRLYSEEFKEYCGAVYQDSFQIRLEQSSTTVVLARKIGQLCGQQTSNCNNCGQHYVGLEPADVEFDQGGVYRTPWVHTEVPVTLEGDGAAPFRLVATIADANDAIYDSVLLIDRITFTPVSP